MADEKIKKLLVNVDQQLTEPEKAMGRHNLGIDSDIPTHVLTYDPQTLSDTQKQQVKANLNFVTPSDLATVATSGSYNDLSDRPVIVTPIQSDWDETNTSSLAYIKNKPEHLVQDANYVHTDNNFTTALKDKLNGIEAGAEVNVQSNWTESDSSSDAYIQNKPANLVQDANYVHTDNNFTTTLKNKLDGVEAGAEVNVQSNWTESDSSSDAYIQNKPANLVQDANYVHTDNNFTTTLKDKLDGIAAGAEVNVQADWTETNTSSDSYIQNKPTLAAVATSGSYNDLSDTPTIPDGVPTVTSTDDGKILTAAYEDGAGSYSWEDAPKGVEYVDLNEINTRFASYNALVTEVNTSGKEFIFYMDSSSKRTYYRLHEKTDKLHLVKCFVNTLMVAYLDAINLSEASGGGITVRSVSFRTQKYSSDWLTSVTPSNYTPRGTYEVGDMVVSYAGSESGAILALYKCKLAYTESSYTQTSKDTTHWERATVLEYLKYLDSKTFTQVQANWNETDTTDPSYIQNKPANLVQDASYVHTDNNFTTTLKNKLDGIAAGAEVNVQADWNQTDTSADDYIKNKPSPVTVMINYGDTSRTIAQLEALITGGTEVIVKQSYLSSGINYDVLYRPVFITESSEIVFTCINDVDGDKVGAKEVTYGYYQGSPTWRQRADRTIEGLPTHSTTTAGKYLQVNSSGTAEWLDLPANLVQDASYVHTDNNFTTTLKNKLDGIAAGAEVNVQSDWNQTVTTADDYIKNKPSNLVQDASYVHTDNNFTTTLKDKLNGIASGAEVNVQSDWSQTVTTADDYIKNKPSNLVQDASYVHTDNNFTTTLKDKLEGIAAGAEVNVQANWTQTDGTADDYIKNKPSNLVQDASYVHTDNNFTTTLKDKLDGIAAGAEVNVQANWTQSDNTADDYIKNKPTDYALTAGSNVSITKDDTNQTITVGASFTQVNADWNSSSGASEILNKPSLATVATSGDYNDLSNKPTIPAAQVQADWNEADSTSMAFIQNKPTIPAAQVNSDWNAVSGVAQILNKPSLATVATSGSYNDLTDKPVAPSDIGDSSTPVYIDTDGTFKECSLNDIVLIQFNSNNTTTAQDSVYTAINTAYQNGKTPVLSCSVGTGALHWFPSFRGLFGYNFTRCDSSSVYVASIDSSTHIISISIKEIKDYTAGTNVTIDANNQISATDTNYTAGTGLSLNGTEFSNTAPNVKSDWNAAAGSDSEILNKPTLGYRGYGDSSVTKASSIVFNADDPDGYSAVMVNNSGKGYLVQGPYKTLLDSGVASSLGDTNKGIYIDSNGTFQECDAYPVLQTASSTSHGPSYSAQDTLRIWGAFNRVDMVSSGTTTQMGYLAPTLSSSPTDKQMLVYEAGGLAPIWEKAYSAGTNISIDSNNVISTVAYTGGTNISIGTGNVINNTMHENTYGVMVVYNSLGTSGSTTLSLGKWRIKIDKSAMVTWDSSDPSIYIKFAHTDYDSGTIDNGRIQVVTYYPWKDGNIADTYISHNQWSFDGSYSQGGSGLGFPIYLSSPTDPDSTARACPRSMRGSKFIVGGGITTADWLELSVEPLYVTNSTSLSSNAARLLIRAKYFYS